MSQKKHSHTEKLLKAMSKRANKPQSGSPEGAGHLETTSLREQYDVIRRDILKLREDLQKGYDLAKGAVEKRTIFGNFFRTR